MVATINDFSSYISKHQKSIAEEVVCAVQEASEKKIPEKEIDLACEMYITLLEVFGDILQAGQKDAVPDFLIEWSKDNARMQVATGGNLSEIVVRYPPTRKIFIEIFTRISNELGLTLTENATIINQINSMLDTSLNETFFAFERLSAQYKEQSRKELLKLSAPIVPVKDGIVVIPLIGFIDDERTNHIIENVLPKLTETGVSHVITDYSGVLLINEKMYKSLYQIGTMLRIMGIQVIYAGLRPDLAQTIVNSGIDRSMIKSYATVKQALQSIE